jgi:predicted chitinase
MQITAAHIYAVAPGAKPEIVTGIVAAQSQLTKALGPAPSSKRVAWMLGRMAVETQGFTRLEENLYYTSTKRLRQVWPSRFKSDAAAAPYVRNPSALANLVYGGRLGNVGLNDGWNYRGSGDLQTTGLENFREVQQRGGVACVNNPELLRAHPGALTAATVFWAKRDLSRYVDAGDMAGLCKAIQGGTLGLADQRLFTDRATKALADAANDNAAPAPREAASWPRQGWSDKAVVAAIQRKLQAHGFYEGGKLDGVFGDGTDNAVRDLQRARGLVVDGVVGPATQAALDATPGLAEPGPVVEPPTVADAGFVALLKALIALIFGLIGASKR